MGVGYATIWEALFPRNSSYSMPYTRFVLCRQAGRLAGTGCVVCTALCTVGLAQRRRRYSSSGGRSKHYILPVYVTYISQARALYIYIARRVDFLAGCRDPDFAAAASGGGFSVLQPVRHCLLLADW